MDRSAQLGPDFGIKLLCERFRREAWVRNHIHQVKVAPMLPVVVALVGISLVEVEQMPVPWPLQRQEHVATK